MKMDFLSSMIKKNVFFYTSPALAGFKETSGFLVWVFKFMYSLYFNNQKPAKLEPMFLKGIGNKLIKLINLIKIIFFIDCNKKINYISQTYDSFLSTHGATKL